MAKTKEDRIKTVYGGGGHVVILGAGASIASTFRNPEPSGKRLPSMDNFIDLLGLSDIVDSLPKKFQAKNFEQFEIIDIRPEEEGVKRWDNFIHSHHYDYTNDYFSSSLAYNPRRTFESYHQHNFRLQLTKPLVHQILLLQT
jgi:hypothetical protein